MCVGSACVGEVAEWSKANDSKSFEGQPSVGSNPTLSAFRSLADSNIPCKASTFACSLALFRPDGKQVVHASVGFNLLTGKEFLVCSQEVLSGFQLKERLLRSDLMAVPEKYKTSQGLIAFG